MSGPRKSSPRRRRRLSKGDHSNGVFITGGLAEVAKATTVTDGDGFTSNVLQVWDTDVVMIQAVLTGEGAGANGDVDFKVVGSVNSDGSWDTIAAWTLVATMIDDTVVRESLQLDVRGFHSIKLLSIQNKDSAKKATLVNVRWGKAYGY